MMLCITRRRVGVRDLVETLRWKTMKIERLLRDLEKDGLVEFRKQPLPRGRPKKIPVVTSLGNKFLDAFRDLEKMRLKANIEDVKSAVIQAKRTDRLVTLGRSPYEMLWELVELATNVRNSAEAHRIV